VVAESVAGMPSQLFDDGYGVYEIPSGDRLTFKGGEGADASYNLPSSFDKASSPQRGRSAGMGSSDRFNAPGSYLAHAGAPGPGWSCSFRDVIRAFLVLFSLLLYVV